MSDRSYPLRPIVGVGAAILVPQSEVGSHGLPSSLPDPFGVVLIKRRFEPLAGQWSLPGGMLEVGETLAAGVAREVLEETGLIVEVGLLVEVIDRIMPDDDGRVRHHFVILDYLCTLVGGALAAASDVSDVAIADPAALTAYGVTTAVESVVSRALAMAVADPLLSRSRVRA